MNVMDKNLESYFTHSKVILRGALDEDVPSLVGLINDAYSYQDETKGEPRTSILHLKRRIGETDFHTVLQDAEIIGCIYLEPRELALHFGLLTLAPDYRGKGIAMAIMAAVDEYASAHKFTTIELDYMSLAPWLKKYYEKYGFLETGEITPWGKVNLIRMQKRIGKL